MIVVHKFKQYLTFLAQILSILKCCHSNNIKRYIILTLNRIVGTLFFMVTLYAQSPFTEIF
jgi:hypothetical protein